MKALLYLVSIVLTQAYVCHCFKEFVYLKKHGIIKGESQDVDNTKVYYFPQIRYGKADRFELPKEDNRKWFKIRTNPTVKIICPQPISVTDLQGKIMSEDCLYLNIWAPSSYSFSKLPVIVFIHGGSFMTGSIQQREFDGKILAARTESVVVTLNYRLSAFGFLSSSDPYVFPNLGLHDQLLALKFVQDNIESFGGDRNYITVMGNSAGAMSIGAFLISPYVRGLHYFHRAIMTSGAPTTPFAVDALEFGVNKTNELIKRVGCDTQPNPIQCLKMIPMQTLIQVQYQMSQDFIFFTPVYGDGILPRNPKELLNDLNLNGRTENGPNLTDLTMDANNDWNNGNVDLLFGLTTDEGSTIYPVLSSLLPSTAIDLQIVAYVIPILLKWLHISSVTEEQVLAQYLPGVNQTDSWEMTKMIGRIYADLNINCPVLYFAERYHYGEEFHTMYSYLLKQKTSIPYNECLEQYGVCHTSEIPYIFGLPLPPNPPVYSPADVVLSTDFIQSINQFVHQGRIHEISHVKWNQAFSKLDLEVMELKAGEYKMAVNPFLNRCKNFWYPILYA